MAKNENTIVKSPATYITTNEIAEKLIGRYEVEEDPQMYFEIKPGGELEISLAFFPEFSELESRTYSIVNNENLLLTVFYTEQSTAICILLVNIDHSFPGGNFAIDFKGDYECTYFVSITYYRDGYLRFVKTD
ncbi:MAG: hypothetical protein FWE74_04360 [Oscillospiraceae bacterium]|nr:hypothetical protein [Oscillospiraceae bacterium]